MPYVKSIPIHTSVNRSLAYILNPDKTEDLLYTASLNCMTNAKAAYLSMKTVYEHYTGEKYNAPLPIEGKGSVKAIHYIQSFDPKDNVSPELAHRIAKAFARKTFGDDCQIVIATHIDRGHVHSHFILNSYSLTGQKFNDNQTTLNHIKEYSDRTCLAFGIQPFDKTKGKGKTMAYNEWEHKKKGTSWKQKIRLEIDRLIGSAKSLDELLSELELKGYEVKRGKYISVKAPEQQRFVRTKMLGEDYTEDSLISRIIWHDMGTDISLSGELSPINIDYNKAIDEVSKLADSGGKIQRIRDSSYPYSSKNDMDIYKLSAQLAILNRDNISSIGELEGKIYRLKQSYENARVELNLLTSKQEYLDTLLEQADTYFSLVDKPYLTVADNLRLNISKQSLQNANINTREDYEHMKSTQQETKQKLAALKENFQNCKRYYDVYSDIAKTYYAISSGDYISKLVKEEQARREREKQEQKKGHSL